MFRNLKKRQFDFLVGRPIIFLKYAQTHLCNAVSGIVLRLQDFKKTSHFSDFSYAIISLFSEIFCRRLRAISLLVVLLSALASCAVPNSLFSVKSCEPKIYTDNSWQSAVYNDGVFYALRHNFILPDFTTRKEVLSQICWYQNYVRSLETYLTHSELYIYYVYREVKQRHLPAELVLLPVIESGYNPSVYSNSAAAGLWQLIPGTGKHLGLHTDRQYDERRDVIASTDAALRYLETLGKKFESNWLLAIAAYNVGEKTVMNAIKRQGDKNYQDIDFWSLRLPYENKIYVARFLAATAIVKDPWRYGVKLPVIANVPYFAEVKFTGQQKLSLLSEKLGVDLKLMQKLNPGWQYDDIDSAREPKLLIPIFKATSATAKTDLITASTDKITAKTATYRRYVVKNGDNLFRLAARSHTSVAALKGLNNLKSEIIHIGQIINLPQ